MTRKDVQFGHLTTLCVVTKMRRSLSGGTPGAGNASGIARRAGQHRCGERRGDRMPDMTLEADPGGLEGRRALELMHGVLRALASAENTDDVLRVIVSDGLPSLQPVGAVLGRQVEDVVAIGNWGSSLELSTDTFESERHTRNPWSDAV